MNEFKATHVAPPNGLRAWSEPDPSLQPITTVQARVEMQVLEVRGAWAHIECSNGWQAWVDARELVSKHAPPPTAPVTTPAPATAPVAAPAAATSFLARPVMTVGARSLVVQDLIPAAGIVLGAILPWFRLKTLASKSSLDVSLMFLFDYKTGSDELKLGWLLLAVAIVSLVPAEKIVHQIALGVAAGAAALYTLQLQRLASEGAGVSLTDLLGFGVVVTLAAAGMGLYWTTRTAQR